jgi:large subunit ribosomal protein L23
MGVIDKITKRKPAAAGTEKKPVKKATKTVKAVAPVKAKKSSMISHKAFNIIIGPIVSEKAASLSSNNNVVVLKVRKSANRVSVRNAVRELYKVTPVRVNMISVRGKNVRFGRFQGKQNDYKKAMVFLPKGATIDLFEGV